MLRDKKRRPKRHHYPASPNLIPLNSMTLYNGKETTSRRLGQEVANDE